MRSNNKKFVNLRLPCPTYLFLTIILIFNIIPTLVILFTDYVPVRELLSESQFDESKLFYSYSLFVFVISFILFRLALSFQKRKVRTHVSILMRREDIKKHFKKTNRWVYSILFVSMVFIVLYSFNGGLEKMRLLGSGIDGRDFRFMGFDDVPRYYTAGLAVARRFLLPILIIYFYIKVLYKIGNHKKLLVFLITLQLYASMLTFARAPFLTLVVGLTVVNFFVSDNKIKQVVYLIIYIIVMLVTAGIVTNLQYNITNFTLSGVLTTGMDFLVNRAWFVPNVVPINLTFSDYSLYSSPLFLEYSRLWGIFGIEVVGTAEQNSIYVSPVGYIGDIWRNFSWLGLIISGVAFALLFRHLDKIIFRLSLVGALIYVFLILAMVFYWIMGVVFSQGAFFAVFIVYMAAYVDISISKYLRSN